MRRKRGFKLAGLLSLNTLIAFIAGFASREKIVEKVPSLEKIKI